MRVRSAWSLRWMCLSALGTVLLACATDRTHGQGPPAATAPAVAPLTDARVDAAVDRGLAWLWKVRKKNGSFNTRFNRGQEGGCAALVALTALTGRRLADAPDLKPTLAYLETFTGAKEPGTVYVRAVRTMVFARLVREDATKYTPLLEAEVKWLLARQLRSGGWGYGPGHGTTKIKPDWVDSCNTQMAVLALRDAANAGAAVAPGVWSRVQSFWTDSQNSDGGWGYVPPGAGMRLRGSSHGSMTAAALASLLIAMEKGPRPAPGAAPAAGKSPDVNVAKGLAWLAEKHTVGSVPEWVWSADEQWVYFYLWCVARACNHAGVRMLGAHDWYPEMAAGILARQRADGSWSTVPAGQPPTDAPVRTCFALLALIEGRGAVLANQLGGKPGGSGAVAGLTRWLGGKFAKPVAWSALPADASVRLLREAPLLYVNLRTTDQLAALPGEKIREYVRRGGSVVVNVNVIGSPTAPQTVVDYFVKLFADQEYRAEALAETHPVVNLYYKLPADALQNVAIVGDDVRTPVFCLLANQGRGWQRPGLATSAPLLQLGANVLFHALGMKPPQGRLAARAPDPATAKMTRAVPIARIKHAGGWSACPLALPRLSAVLAGALSLGVKESPAVDLTRPVPASMPMLWMTGTRDPRLTAAQKDNLKAYVRGGGTLFLDSTAGRGEFAAAAEKMLGEMFGPERVRKIEITHPLVTGQFGGGAGSDVREVEYTPAGKKARPDGKIAGLIGVEIGGRMAVVLSTYGVTAGVEGLPAFGAVGLATPDARRLAANVVLYTLMGP